MAEKQAKICGLILSSSDQVDWHKLLWASLDVPKNQFYSFINYPKQGASTNERQICTGRSINPVYILCNQASESKNIHLFFSCRNTKNNLFGTESYIRDWDIKFIWAKKNLRKSHLCLFCKNKHPTIASFCAYGLEGNGTLGFFFYKENRQRKLLERF